MDDFRRSHRTLRRRFPGRRISGVGAATHVCVALAVMLQAAISVVQASQPAEQRPERIVSLHLCADQYLLSLADPEQIVALGPYAHNADISFQAERARHWPSLEATAEEVLALKPDLVLAAAFTNPSTLEALRRLGHRVMRLQHVQTIKDQRRQIMEDAAAIGHPEDRKSTRLNTSHVKISSAV